MKKEDNVYDVRLERRLKRRNSFYENVKQNHSEDVIETNVRDHPQIDYPVMVEEDYQGHLHYIVKYGDLDVGHPLAIDDSSFSENTEDRCANSQLDEHDSVDKDYMIFLKYLRQVGKSYVLEVPTENGTRIFEYEREDVIFDRLTDSPEKSHTKGVEAEHTRILRSSSSERARMTDENDEKYMKYFNYLENNKKLLNNSVSRPTSDPTLISDDNAGSCDSEVIILDFDPSASKSFFTSKSAAVTVDVDSGKCLQLNPPSKSSQFRAGLLKDLKKPYNQTEYESLLEEVSCRKASQRDRIFRSGIKSYKLDSLGKSYLDLYGDLAAKIDQVRSDRRKVLNLLRGFFYWLKNLAHEGAFPPWLDPCCMKDFTFPKLKDGSTSNGDNRPGLR